jgi:hypothetical protein
MRVGSQEFYDLVSMFDREFKGSRLDKEPKNMWPKGHVYQHGEMNNLFLAYRKGYALGLALTSHQRSQGE